ncbi:hypothetical protein D5S18_24225 [Nocardia panacis]|uniref:Uncharacterized protein n=1 Tax=Nocardia panacis TaxID=2340916 RepID=A0A3A4K5D2_9NOCA|nr:hypothetical protein [Nocardia panacis]RJO72265.1 hypothetical protein D5S18_24225 [Nocardia panacis]
MKLDLYDSYEGLDAQLTHTGIVRTIRRKDAQRTLDGLLDRIDHTEHDPHFFWVVDRAMLVGTMLDSRNTPVCAVDVALNLIRHPDPDRNPPQDQMDLIFDSWWDHTPLPSDFPPWCDDIELMHFLKNKDWALNLTDLDVYGHELPPIDVPYRLVYDRRFGRFT